MRRGEQGTSDRCAQARREAHLDGREAHPAHAVRGAAVVLGVEQEDAAQDEERGRVRARDDLQGEKRSCTRCVSQEQHMWRSAVADMAAWSCCTVRYDADAHGMAWSPWVIGIRDADRKWGTWRRTEIMPMRFSDPRRSP